ncbi:MAG: DNA polymerase III subunit gamma/tau [Acidobacteria bacterium]|nr:DNA polymerase III subunit gamma/tau [Acidobacteriota bacterium]
MTTLALKYRPRLLSDLVGQEASVKALSNALKRAKETGKLHQAYLFAGVRGTGKTSTARILARSLNCAQGPTASPCGTCEPCIAAEKPDQNLDIVEIDAASRASVDDARALRDQVQTRPAFCRYRVYIIDEVHMLSQQAFDALLKVIEEPPPHAVFVLATTELHDVPDTIKSRVQIFPFRLIPVPVIEARLKWVCDQEGVSTEGEALRLVAESGQGSMRDALTTLDRVIAAGDGKVLEEAVREQLGIVPAVRVQGALEAMASGDTAAILGHCEALASLGADWTTFWRELVTALRLRMEQEVRAGKGPQDLLRWARITQLLLQRERDLRDTALPRVVVELALITAAQLPHLAPLETLTGGRAATSTPASGPPPPRPSAAPAPTPRPALEPVVAAKIEAPKPAKPMMPGLRAGMDTESLRRACAEAVKAVEDGRFRAFAAIFHMASGLAYDGAALALRFPADVRNTVSEFEREQANPMLLRALGVPRVDIVFEGPATAERPEDRLRKEPALQELLRLTGGEIVEIKKEG